MDAYMRHSLDNYITGVNQTHTELVQHRCPDCGLKREIGMVFDMGACFYFPASEKDKTCCPECGGNLEIID